MFVIGSFFTFCATAFLLSPQQAGAVIFENRCALFREFTERYKVPADEAAVWTCIAEANSAYNTGKLFEAVQFDEKNYGLFQINGNVWCKDGENRCDVDCDDLLDDDLTDDLKCARTIRDVEGLKAWGSYETCKDRLDVYMSKDNCKVESPAEVKSTQFSRCELARELYYEHGVPFDQVPTWVCLAEEESGLMADSFNGDAYGLFRISSRHWCSEDPYNLTKTCKLPCDHLLDNQIADDVRCARAIYNETAKYRMDGDGFRAWNSYMRKCHNKSRTRGMVKDCFDAGEKPKVLPAKTRAYTPCELAQEMYQKHGVVREDIAPFVCIAFHDSRLVTSSQRFPHGQGLFQLRDKWWCHNGDGKAKDCDVTCEQLRDLDISDDIACSYKVKKNHAGFIGWITYADNCTGTAPESILEGCDLGTPAPMIVMANDFVELPTQAPTPAPVTTVVPTPAPTTSAPYKIYDECSLSQELVNTHKFSKSMAATFTCIAKEESGFDQRSMTSWGSIGLFRISDVYWCSKKPEETKPCGPCFSYIDDDITDDVMCAKKIFEDTATFKPTGYHAWDSYERSCSDETTNLKAIQHCFKTSNSNPNWFFPGVTSNAAMNFNAQNSVGNFIQQRPVQQQNTPAPNDAPQPQPAATAKPTNVEKVETTTAGDYLIYFTNPSMTLKVTAQIEENRLEGKHIRIIPLTQQSDGRFGVSILVEPEQSSQFRL